MTRITCVAEPALSDRLRQSLARLLAETLDGGARYEGRAWMNLPPAFRVVAFDDHDRPRGQVSAFAIATDPPVRLVGLGDLAVETASRGRGIARALSVAVVDECWRRGAAVALCKTRPMRKVLGEIGFVAIDGFTCFWEDERACHRHPDWMAGFRGPRPERLWLAHGDF